MTGGAVTLRQIHGTQDMLDVRCDRCGRAGRYRVATLVENEADITAARAMLKVNGISVAEVAERVGVSPSTLHRHLPGGRGVVG